MKCIVCGGEDEATRCGHKWCLKCWPHSDHPACNCAKCRAVSLATWLKQGGRL